jgi:glycosyltransferase involved in cell wall biosynthesis
MATVLYTAAHAHFPDTEPLGGGKAVADYLCRHHPHWQVISPASLKMNLETSLTEMSERRYARFCRQFERAATDEILRHRPGDCVVLSNDISEGPDFARLGSQGYRIATIFHVDVVDYFTRFYLRGWFKPETTAKWSRYRGWPDMLKLVFHKQADCVRHSARLIVPSEPMRDLLLRCYECPPVEVVPWGNVSDVQPARRADTGHDEFVILTLSRLSPEKGLERLLAALPHVRTGGRRLRVVICGAPAYMKGRRYAARLQKMADQITNATVEFPGHVVGEQKADWLARADLFVSPSLHESYGLTIAEAMAAGCPVISHGHYGARGEIVDCSDPVSLAAGIESAMNGVRATEGPGLPMNSAKRMSEILSTL